MKDAHKSLLLALHRSACRLHEESPHKIPLCEAFSNFDIASESFLHLCRLVIDKKRDKIINLQETIVDHIQREFSDPSLNLASISVATGHKESSLYYLFTRHLRKSFSQYLEEFRLEKARDMLLNDENRPISSIASSVGYANPQTFRRAFKKHYGMTPSAYRDQKK
jgi:AraC-like DNA-binding protein